MAAGQVLACIKHEDLSLDPLHSDKRLGTALGACHPVLEDRDGEEPGASWPASLVESASSRFS